MISVILSILKLILIILACIIGLLLLIICLILFVPIRYELNVKSVEKISAKGRISWLLRLLSLRMSYEDEILRLRFTILGIPIYKTDDNHNKTQNKESNKSSKNIKKDILKEANKGKDINSGKRAIKQVDDGNTDKKEKTYKEKTYKEKTYKETKAEKPSKKSVFLEKINDIKNIFIKVIYALKSFLVKIYKLLLGIKDDQEPSKPSLVKEFLKENKPGIKVLIKATKELLKHIKPKVLKGNIEFGLDDPSVTGQVLGLISVFYGLYYESFKIIPNFEEEIFQGQVYIKGRIRIFTVILIVFKTLLNKQFQKLINDYKVLKEEL